MKPIKKGAYNDTIKQAVEDFLVDSTVLMHVYIVHPFEFNISKQKHKQNRTNIQTLERHLIKAFINEGKYVGNRSVIKNIKSCPYPELFERIRLEFKLIS